MSGGIETTQLQPLDDDARREHRAAITCADYAQRHGLDDHQLLELLRELGLAHDPMALDRDPIDTSTARPRGPQ